jgi:hypothetical protein
MGKLFDKCRIPFDLYSTLCEVMAHFYAGRALAGY